MALLREAFERAIDYAESLPEATVPGERGHVYIAMWRFCPQRDLSEDNEWRLGRWQPGRPPLRDQTALGLVLRLMSAGVRVRMLLWYPEVATRFIVGAGHMDEHLYAARMVRAWNDHLLATRFAGAPAPLGVVGLDLRVADSARPAAEQQPQAHEKLVVVRAGPVAEAHCGGIDLAFTRRDAPLMSGDWQSAGDIPSRRERWPGWAGYPGLDAVEPPEGRLPADLPPEVYGERRQIWHDQHVVLEGPVVSTVEEGFRRRWTEPGDVVTLDEPQADRPRRWRAGSVVFSSPQTAPDGSIRVLPPASPVESAGSSTVQIWRTTPVRSGPPGTATRGEYTAMGGIANACLQARELIWIFDQYFWNRALARLLNRLLRERPGLRLILVLPPHAGGGGVADEAARTVHTIHHRARALALDDLTAGLGRARVRQVGVFNLWQHTATGGRGVFCHAKAQTYDGSLLACGSANLNWRSFTRDVESTAAVLDPAVVREHQRRLWGWLFPGAPWPVDQGGEEIHLDTPGSGASFFAAFTARVRGHPSYLIPDRWRIGSHHLPNGVLRGDDVSGLPNPDELLRLTDPIALSPPGAGPAGADPAGDAFWLRPLDEVVADLGVAGAGLRAVD